jgi:hypothetical protein
VDSCQEVQVVAVVADKHQDFLLVKEVMVDSLAVQEEAGVHLLTVQTQVLAEMVLMALL